MPFVVVDDCLRIFMFRRNVVYVFVLAVVLRYELRQISLPRFALATIVECRPIPRELLNDREMNALGLIFDGHLFWPLRGGDAPAEVSECIFRNVDLEWSNCNVAFGPCGHLLDD